MKTLRVAQSAFTMVELSIYMLIGVVLGAVSLSFLITSATLATKNSNLNRSHEDLRLAFDRMAHQVAAANNVATLIDTTGATVTSPTVNITTPMAGTLTGPAAGFKFDQVIAEPYVLESPQTANNPLAAGTIASTTTTINVFYAKNQLTHVAHLTQTASAADVSAEGFILLIPQPDGSNIRWQIASVGARTSSGSYWYKLPLTFSAPIGKTISWSVNQPQMVKIVRNEAFLVMKNFDAQGNEFRELRYYKDFEPMPVLSDKTKYVVLCDQIGVKAGEDTPFSVVNYGGDKMIQSTLRVRERANKKWIEEETNGTFYTYFQLLVNLPSRFRPRTTE
jgi:type II secretory pathway pseudopilin PulG